MLSDPDYNWEKDGSTSFIMEEIEELLSSGLSRVFVARVRRIVASHLQASYQRGVQDGRHFVGLQEN